MLPLHAAAEAPRPNVILIVADDLGYGDLGAYGATDLATPNIDRLAQEGLRFTDFYAVANTCSPSRAALMTGRYPPRSGVNAVLFHDTPEGLPDREITIAELLRDAGYRTAMIGKWHLGATGEFMPLRHGFSEFFGVPHSNDEKNFFVYDGPDRLPESVDQSRLIRRYTDRALEFLERARRTTSSRSSSTSPTTRRTSRSTRARTSPAARSAAPSGTSSKSSMRRSAR